MCSVDKIHSQRVRDVCKNLEDEQTTERMASLFSTFSDPTRLRILLALERMELCGCDLCAITGATKSAVSHQMRILKMANLVKSRREGKQIFYSLADRHVLKLLKTALEHVKER